VDGDARSDDVHDVHDDHDDHHDVHNDARGDHGDHGVRNGVVRNDGHDDDMDDGSHDDSHDADSVRDALSQYIRGDHIHGGVHSAHDVHGDGHSDVVHGVRDVGDGI